MTLLRRRHQKQPVHTVLLLLLSLAVTLILFCNCMCACERKRERSSFAAPHALTTFLRVNLRFIFAAYLKEIIRISPFDF